MLATAKLDAHWKLSGEVHESITAAVGTAQQAAAVAQATRRRAQLLAARLDAAAMIIENGSRSAQIQLVAHQLQDTALNV